MKAPRDPHVIVFEDRTHYGFPPSRDAISKYMERHGVSEEVAREAVSQAPRGDTVMHLPLSAMLTCTAQTDAHFVQYDYQPTNEGPFSVRRRVSIDSLRDPQYADVLPLGGFKIDLVAFDIDGPDHKWTPEWWAAERVKLDALLSVHPGLFVYVGRGGYRPVGLLDTPHVLKCGADDASWKSRYRAWCNYLERRFGIAADRACDQWNRYFRIPHATREGSTVPEALETIGDPNNVGVWAPQLEAVDHVEVKLAKASTPKAPGAAKTPAPASSDMTYDLPDRLYEWAEVVGRACAEQCPVIGERRELAKTLAGALANDPPWGLTLEQVPDFVGLACEIAGFGKLENKIEFAQRTVLRARAGERISGWPQLREKFPLVADAINPRFTKFDTPKVPESSINVSTPLPANDAAQATPTPAPAPKANAKRFVLVGANALAEPVPPVSYVLKHFGISPGRPTLLAGYGGLGKTFVAQCLGLHIAARLGTCWDLPIASGGVVHLDYEMTLRPTQRRYQRLAFALGIDLAKCDLHVVSMPDIYLNEREAFDALVDACTGRTLCILDNLAAATAGGADKGENDTKIRVYLDLLTRVSEVTGCTILVLVHERKASKDEQGGLQKVRGSSAITDAAGSVISMSAAEGDGVVQLAQTKSSVRRKGDDLVLAIEDVLAPIDAAGLLSLDPDDDPPGLVVRRLGERPISERGAEIQKRILELLAKGPQESKRKVDQALGLKNGTASVEIEALLVRREIVKLPGKGFCLDTPQARQERVREAGTVRGYLTIAQLAKAAYVDTGVVEEALRLGVIFKCGSGVFIARGGQAA